VGLNIRRHPEPEPDMRTTLLLCGLTNICIAIATLGAGPAVVGMSLVLTGCCWGVDDDEADDCDAE
jgi:hypothetical protein